MSRPTALVLTPRLPWPLDDGGRIGLWQSVWGAAQEYDVVLLSLDSPAACAAPIPASVEALVRHVVRVPHTPPGVVAAALRGTFGRWPHTMTRFFNDDFEAAVGAAVRDHRPEVAIVNHLHMAIYARALGAVPRVLREHNVESSWMRRYAGSRTNPAVSAYARLQAARLRAFEREACLDAALVLAIQEPEAAELRALAPDARIEIVPIGIDFDRFGERRPVSPPVVLIIGTFGWAPNEEGVLRFARGGWDELRRLVPGVRLRVVGRGLRPAAARELAALGIEAAGFVPAAEPEFAAASLVLVPLWLGAGARIKIVEAVAAGVPVVSTPLGAEGLDLVAGDEIALAPDPLGLARAAAQVLTDPAAARDRAARARTRAAATYSLPVVAARTNALCRSVARGAHA